MSQTRPRGVGRKSDSLARGGGAGADGAICAQRPAALRERQGERLRTYRRARGIAHCNRDRIVAGLAAGGSTQNAPEGHSQAGYVLRAHERPAIGRHAPTWRLAGLLV